MADDGTDDGTATLSSWFRPSIRNLVCSADGTATTEKS